VELHGLNAKKLNRQRGEVVGFDASSGRCELRSEIGPRAQTLPFKAGKFKGAGY
jgi:hypothetical protein